MRQAFAGIAHLFAAEHLDGELCPCEWLLYPNPPQISITRMRRIAGSYDFSLPSWLNRDLNMQAQPYPDFSRLLKFRAISRSSTYCTQLTRFGCAPMKRP